MAEIRTYLSPRKRVVVTCGKSKTLQSFAKAADINNIIKKYKTTGFLVDPGVVKTQAPYYGDFSSGVDYQSMLNKIAGVNSIFSKLNANLRNRFRNDPAIFLDFVNNPENLEECVKLGLLPKEYLPKVTETPPKEEEVVNDDTPPTE